ncbi:DISP complex protein LRCH3 isoform X3 [Danio rerio]|uniref:DISP complex protein LRCH3 isoform X3 n=1 Tax=Danio rerio TaxID=7955 RepID=A0A8M6YTK7_DANRE|nr:leucine-rich repeat and calponin homology domain-containing protein 3 isoform X3 [Danio rerio]|eukprot:XP_017207473.1 leucine-rich repeat and calponin homology domain-containing protein 3 isoform X3 [Danio rerio]
MAASVLLSAESAVPSFTVGHPAGAIAAGGTTHHGLSNAPGPASWNRSLDRALDEAAATGGLNLSGRKLKEFPRSAAGHDLTDTTRADLSRNRLTELPVEVCMFVSLENLNLYQNCLRSLPESLINLQSLTYLNLSRNQLSTLPAHLCRLPLKVLIACNNKLVSLPEDLGKLRQLTELDVSCNEIQTLPPQIGQLEALRDLNIRRNHLVRLPPELAELPLVRLDFSCNKVTSIPVCYRNLRHLQSIILDNNPLQSPPAQICIKGKIHIFKYLNMEACKAASELPDYDRRPLPFGSCVEDLYSGRPYGALDSGFNSVDSGDKRWSGNEPSDELSDLPLRVAEITKEQRQRRERDDHRTATHITNGTMESEMEQIDFIDSCTAEDDDEEGRSRRVESVSLSSQFMAYIERRITREGSPVKTSPSRTDDPRRQTSLHNRGGSDSSGSSSYAHNQRSAGGGVERVRREAQLAALRYEEERQKTRSVQRDAVMNFVKHKSSQSPTKLSPTDSESDFEPLLIFEIDTDTNTIKKRPDSHKQSLSAVLLDGCVSPTMSIAPFCTQQQGEDYASPTALQSPSYPSPAALSPSRGPNQRPESYLFRLSQREEKKKGESGTQKAEPVEATPTQSPAPTGEEALLIEQLRRNIECRLKVSLPSDLGAALTDGVVLCHLANHVRPRSIPSIHVPSPAVPKLTMAKCRRNVENFLEACRRIGVPQDSLCSAGDVLEGELVCVFRLVEALLSLAPPPLRHAPSSQLAGFALFYLSIMSLLCAIYCHLVPSV